MAQQQVYTGVAGHSYEPANKQQIHSQQQELRREGNGYWSGAGAYYRSSPFAYGYWNRQRWGWGDNEPYHYHGPSHHDSHDNDYSNYHHTRHHHRRG